MGDERGHVVESEASCCHSDGANWRAGTFRVTMLWESAGQRTWDCAIERLSRQSMPHLRAPDRWYRCAVDASLLRCLHPHSSPSRRSWTSQASSPVKMWVLGDVKSQMQGSVAYRVVDSEVGAKSPRNQTLTSTIRAHLILLLYCYRPNTSLKALQFSLARTLCRRLGVSDCPVDVVGGEDSSLSSSSQYSLRLTSSLRDGTGGNVELLGAARWHS